MKITIVNVKVRNVKTGTDQDCIKLFISRQVAEDWLKDQNARKQTLNHWANFGSYYNTYYRISEEEVIK